MEVPRRARSSRRRSSRPAVHGRAHAPRRDPPADGDDLRRGEPSRLDAHQGGREMPRPRGARRALHAAAVAAAQIEAARGSAWTRSTERARARARRRGSRAPPSSRRRRPARRRGSSRSRNGGAPLCAIPRRPPPPHTPPPSTYRSPPSSATRTLSGAHFKDPCGGLHFSNRLSPARYLLLRRYATRPLSLINARGIRARVPLRPPTPPFPTPPPRCRLKRAPFFASRAPP